MSQLVPAYLGGTRALATDAVVGTPSVGRSDVFVPDSENLADAAGVVFDMVQPKMAAMLHCHIVDGYIDPVFEGVRVKCSGPATLCQGLTVFNVTPEAVTAREATIEPTQQAV